MPTNIYVNLLFQPTFFFKALRNDSFSVDNKNVLLNESECVLLKSVFFYVKVTYLFFPRVRQESLPVCEDCVPRRY